MDNPVTRAEFEQLKREFEDIKGGRNINRYLPDIEKEIMQQAVSDVILDVVWNDYFYYSSSFESIDRYLGITTGSGLASINDNGIVLEVTAAVDEASVHLGAENGTEFMRFDRDTRFRAECRLDIVTNTTFVVGTLRDGVGSGIDFVLEDGTLRGEVRDGTSTSTVTLGTIAGDQLFVVEFDYRVGGKTTFYVDGVEKGAITDVYPKDLSGDKYLFNAELTTTDSVGQTAFVKFFEFIQKK